jgi:two-component system, OmpR family, sensor kinase
MKWPDSLQYRLALAIGTGLALIWIGTSWFTARLLLTEMNKVFDSTLEETAQRILPLAVMDIVEREEEGISQRISTLRTHDEHYTYLVRDAQGRVLMRSHSSQNDVFPPYDGMGFRQTETHRLYYDAALRETITIAVAEPLSIRVSAARETLVSLAYPLLIIIPMSFLAVFFIVRQSLTSILLFRDRLAQRSAGDLSPIASGELPEEIRPLAEGFNQVLDSLSEAFQAERSFAANAAHEIRTPIAAALALAQRLAKESSDPAVIERADDIQTSLKRLNRLSNKLMQLARAEGGRLRSESHTDIRPVLNILVTDFKRVSDGSANDIDLQMPDDPVFSDIDIDALSILCRNLVENALRHGTGHSSVQVRLKHDGSLIVANDGPLVSSDELERLTARFERGNAKAIGSGLGLSIVRTIVNGIGGTLLLASPREGYEDGFEATVKIPTLDSRRP